MTIPFGPRRAIYTDISEERWLAMSESDVAAYESLDRYYRALCTMLYNYAPMSGHPGGSISSGRFVSALLFDAAAYDLSDPGRSDADVLSYAAGHKALGLYAMWALRNEIARIAAPDLLPPDTRKQLRLEDLLGFRRNPITRTPLFQQFGVKPLDGHPTLRLRSSLWRPAPRGSVSPLPSATRWLPSIVIRPNRRAYTSSRERGG